MNRLASKMFVLAALALAACDTATPPSLFGDENLIVNTPRFNANKLLFMGEPKVDANKVQVWSELEDPSTVSLKDVEADHRVHNNDPVTIVVNRVALPASLTDNEGPKTRDIAVILDFAATAGQREQSIVVWYQRGVPADEPLSFNDLVVYSQDRWDNRVPPYFRMRLVDVSAERSARTLELLNQVGGFSGSLAQVFLRPVAGPIIETAARAAAAVLSGRDNEMLVDFTFQLFSSAQTSQAGGVPLGLFRKGGLVVMGLPADRTRDYWANSFVFEHVSTRVYTEDASETRNLTDAPFLLATVITADVVVPDVVRARSQAITELLSESNLAHDSLDIVLDSLSKLETSLEVFKEKELFANAPTVDSFTGFVGKVDGSFKALSDAEWFTVRATMQRVTGKHLTTSKEYLDWIENCRKHVPFDPDTRRFNLDQAVDNAPPECKP